MARFYRPGTASRYADARRSLTTALLKRGHRAWRDKKRHCNREQPSLWLLVAAPQMFDFCGQFVRDLLEAALQTAEVALAERSKSDTATCCLEAHRLLMRLNPENAAKFRPVVEVLEAQMAAVD